MNVDSFIEELSGWQRKQCSLVVHIIRNSADGIAEDLKWGNPYFDLNGGFIKLFVAKDWINVYFYKGYLLQSKLLEPSDNVKMRTVKIYPNKPLNKVEFTKLVDQAIKLNQK